MFSVKLLSKESAVTEAVGKALAHILQKGSVVALYGGLAAGKTTLSRALFAEKGFTSGFSSPTFTIINEYESHGATACHIDAYRLSDVSELEYTGYYESLAVADFTVIEWADIIKSVLPNDVISVRLNFCENNDERLISIDVFYEWQYLKLREELSAYTCD